MLGFPDVRLRRVRESDTMRSLVRETRLSASHFIYPLFVTHGEEVKAPIEPMPGCFHLSLDLLADEAREIASLGIPGVLLFGLPPEKDAVGSGAYDPEGIVQEAIRVIKEAAPSLMVIGDVCLCEYTDHGHCGVIDGGRVDNDKTLELLAKTALAQVQAGADMVQLSVGMLGSIMVASPEALVIDDEMCGAILRSVRGIDVTADALDLAMVESVVTGDGHYLGHPQTLDLMRTEYVYPTIGDRASVADWETAGRPAVWDRARQRVSDILSAGRPGHLPAGAEESIRSAFDILVPPQP